MRNQFICKFLTVFFLLISINAKAQVDTIFWFAAPDVDAGYGDSPIYLRISSVDQPAKVFVILPANPLISYTFDLAPNSTNSINLSSVKDFLETQANTTANNGIKIESTANISVYYDVVGTGGTRIQNTEIFVLKGRYALGKKFYTPIQNTLRNAPEENGYSGFDIVATEDNTTVTINPTAVLYGNHPANLAYTVQLNTGQTYSARALSKDPSGHPAGSLVTSTKPIAITVKDDCLQWPSGACRDLTGDQIVPVDFIGTDYIVLKGELDGSEQVVIFGTETNTQIYIKGVLHGTINPGGIMSISISDAATYIKTSRPVYLMHLSGFGCQLGAPILPSIECSGYDQISFTRSINYPFILNIMTKAGNEDAFSLNGNQNAIPASSFTSVPNKTDWVYAKLTFTEAQIPVNTGNIIKNSKGNFQLGLINGSSASGSSCYGYFSGFNQFNPSIIAKDTCLNSRTAISLTDEITLNSLIWNFGDPSTGISNISIAKKPYHVFSAPGTYTITADMKYACGIKTVTRTITIPPNMVLNLFDSVKTCGDSVLLDPSPDFPNCKFFWSNNSTDSAIRVSKSGNYQVRVTNLAGCTKTDGSIVYNPFDTWHPKKNTEYCKNGSVILDALLPDCEWSTGETTQTITVDSVADYRVIAQKQGCTDTATIVVNERALPKFTLEDSLEFCTNSDATISVKNPVLPYYKYLWSNGAKTQSTTVFNSDFYSVEVKDDINCTTLDTIKAILYKLPAITLNQDVIVCAEDSVKLYNLSGTLPVSWSTGEFADTIYVKDMGSYSGMVTDAHCTNSDTIVVNNWPLPTVGFNSEEYFCKGTKLELDAGEHVSYMWSTTETTSIIYVSSPGSYYVDIKDVYLCNTRDSIAVYEWEVPEIVNVDTIPNGNLALTAENGSPPYTYSLNSKDFQQNNTFYPVDPGIYNLGVKDVNACITSQNFQVSDDIISIPEYFSPNGDGINDTWIVDGLDSYPKAEIKIFDRYGKLYVTFNGTSIAWDGMYQNKPMPANDYWYIIDLKDRKKPFTGHVTIVR